MRLRILNEDSCEFDIGHVVDVVDSGMQPVYRLNLQDGKSVRLTANHRVLTERGWKSLREAVGLSGSGPHAVMTRPCSLITNGEPAHRNRVWLEKQRRSGASVAEMAGSAGCSYHTMRKWLRRHGLQFSLEERGFPKGQVPWNTARPVRVVACEYVGVEQTYDLCVDGPWHNFVANGIVVHNSFNEESARYHKLASDFYVPARGAVRTQVGKPGSYSFEPVDEAVADDARDTFARVYKQLYAEYQALLDKGVAKELARSLLPFGIYTQFYWTLNARSLMNFLSLRNSDDAQYEIRTYAEAVERLFAQKMPVTYECFVEFERKVP